MFFDHSEGSCRIDRKQTPQIYIGLISQIQTFISLIGFQISQIQSKYIRSKKYSLIKSNEALAVYFQILKSCNIFLERFIKKC